MNTKQLTVLKYGAAYWNEWRKKNPKQVIDLSGVNLNTEALCGAKIWDDTRKGANLKGIDLSFANLTGANLEGVNLTGANLSECVLTDVNFWDACLVDSNLSSAVITGANLVDADLSNARVMGIEYTRKGMPGKYKGIKAETCYGDTDFRNAALDQAYIDGVKRKVPGIIYWAWGFFTDFGRSLYRIMFFTLCFIALFSLIYYLDFYLIHRLIAFKPGGGFLTPLYFSVMIFSTMGSDAVPQSGFGECVVMAEVVVGYLMLGLMLTVLAKNFSPRA